MLAKKAQSKFDNRKTLKMTVQGSKHSFSRVFPCFLQFQKGILRNVPNIKDIEIQIEIMKNLGFDLHFDDKSNSLSYDGTNQPIANQVKIGEYSSKYSRSLINLYPIFSRYDLKLKEPTGCPIGRRDISWYVDIMNKFGISVNIENRVSHVYRSKIRKVNEIKIRDRSFSSTNIAITCALETKSNIKILCPSIEPEIFDLLFMLEKAGVDIYYDGDNDYISIIGEAFDEIKFLDHTILPDRNVIVTLACGALLLRKDIKIELPGYTEQQLLLLPFLNVLKELSIEYKLGDNGLSIYSSLCDLRGKEINIKAGHYPLFCSDWQPLIAVLAALGVNMTIEDTLFESRFGYLNEYRYFGVQHEMLNNRKARIFSPDNNGLNKDQKIKTTAIDLRCGAGLGLLSMLHNGFCEIENDIQIKRGYESYDKLLNQLIGFELYSYI